MKIGRPATYQKGDVPEPDDWRVVKEVAYNRAVVNADERLSTMKMKQLELYHDAQ